MNSRADKPAELIARYLDSILRRGSKAGAQEGSLEDVLDAALALFRYVQVGQQNAFYLGAVHNTLNGLHSLKRACV